MNLVLMTQATQIKSESVKYDYPQRGVWAVTLFPEVMGF